ncbi:MAG: phosphatase PAP2 family protein [Bryobacteraceae bacterium]
MLVRLPLYASKLWLPTLLLLLFPFASCPQDPAAARRLSWQKTIPAVLSDQKHIWTYPLRIPSQNRWKSLAIATSVTAALVAADPHNTPYFRRTTTFDGFNRAFSSRNTHWAILAAPASLYAFGLARRDLYQQHTALLAGVAVADSAIVTVVLKGATSRLRPRDVAPGGSFADTWFQSRGNNWLRGRGSFPSGHTSAAFSVAAVISRRYPRHRWLPYVAYGAAAAIGFSRVSLSSHFPSDVFMGAALGYSISRYTVLR